MSVIIITKEAIRLQCPSCGHVWLCISKKKYVTCPSCRTTLSSRKHVAPSGQSFEGSPIAATAPERSGDRTSK